MLRCLFAPTSLLSLVLCVATLALWARSYGTNDWLNQDGLDRRRTVYSACGRIMYFEQDDSAMTEMGLLPHWRGPAPRWRYTAITDPVRPDTGDATWLNRLGIAVEWHKRGTIYTLYSPRPVLVARTLLILPHWLPACFFTLLPSWRLFASVRVRLRRIRAAVRGLCPTCGYDLRASKDRCPECGSRIREDRERGVRSAAPSATGRLLDPDDGNHVASPDEHVLAVAG